MASDHAPTVDEVESLLDDIQHWGNIDDSLIPAKTRSTLIALCRHYLATSKPPQMTAGEFAGLVVEEITMKSEKYDEQAARCDEDDGWLIGFFAGFDEVEMIIRNLAAEHNIEIVEPKK